MVPGETSIKLFVIDGLPGIKPISVSNDTRVKGLDGVADVSQFIPKGSGSNALEEDVADILFLSKALSGLVANI